MVAIIVVIIAFIYYKNRMIKIEIELKKAQEKAQLLEKYESQLLLEKKKEEEKELEEKRAFELKQREIEFNNKYLMRLMTKQDHLNVIEICENVYDGTDFVDTNFLYFLNDDKYIFMGCLDKELNKIIATIIIEIFDGGYSGWLMGIRTHSNYQRKGIAFKLTQFTMNEIIKLYPMKLHRFRSIYTKSNEISVKFHEKLDMEIIDNMKFIFMSSHFIKDKKWKLFENKLNELINDKIYNENKNDINIWNEYLNNFEELKCRDIDNIICILINYYKQKDILLEWKLFDLQIIQNDEEEEEEEDEKQDETDKEEEEDIDDQNSDSLEQEEEQTGSHEESWQVINDEDLKQDDDNNEDDENDDVENEQQHQEDQEEDEDEEEEEQNATLIRQDTMHDEVPPVINDISHDLEDSRDDEEELYEDSRDSYAEDSAEQEDDYDDDMELEDDEEIVYEKNINSKSVEQFKSYLFDQMNGGFVRIYCCNTNERDQEDGALCIEWRNDKVRKHCTLYHIYGNNEMAIMSMIRNCYQIWEKGIYDKDENKQETIDFFINKEVVINNEKLKWLFEGSDECYISEKMIDCDIDKHEE